MVIKQFQAENPTTTIWKIQKCQLKISHNLTDNIHTQE